MIILLLKRLLLGFLLLQIRLIPSFIPSLLILCKRLVKHFKLHGLCNVSSLAKPENQIVTFLYAARGKSYPMIKICQFICPFFPVISFFQFLQNLYALFQAYFLRNI